MKKQPKPFEKEKEPYEKPVLRTIELAADEVLASGCKFDDGGFDPMASPCVATPCSGAGS